jgi:hypothetical protein
MTGLLCSVARVHVSLCSSSILHLAKHAQPIFECSLTELSYHNILVRQLRNEHGSFRSSPTNEPQTHHSPQAPESQLESLESLRGTGAGAKHLRKPLKEGYHPLFSLDCPKHHGSASALWEMLLFSY